MRRREFITLLGSLAVAGVRSLYAHAQGTIKVWRVGILDTTSAKSANLEVFRNALSQLGYVEGQNLIIEYRSGEGHIERFPELATEMVGSQGRYHSDAGNAGGNCRWECHQDYAHCHGSNRRATGDWNGR
jgi:hypothetical protein